MMLGVLTEVVQNPTYPQIWALLFCPDEELQWDGGLAMVYHLQQHASTGK